MGSCNEETSDDIVDEIGNDFRSWRQFTKLTKRSLFFRPLFFKVGGGGWNDWTINIIDSKRKNTHIVEICELDIYKYRKKKKTTY